MKRITATVLILFVFCFIFCSALKLAFIVNSTYCENLIEEGQPVTKCSVK